MEEFGANLVFDRQAFLERIGGDEELLVEIGALYKEDAPQNMAAYSSAIAANDLDSAARSAHQLKGSSGNIGANRMAAAAAAAESASRQGDAETAKSLAPILQQCLEELFAQLPS